MKRALLSVSDKTNIIPFSKELISLGYELISTGGTKKTLEEHKIKVKGIEEVTGFPEILDGRVKTLHPLVHGGLLAIRDNKKHQEMVKENNIEYIDLVVVNLYPFKETISKPNVTYEEAIENIDIGGPSMLRSAAKNHRFVTVIADPADYESVINELKTLGDTTKETKEKLALKVFKMTAEYDACIAKYLMKEEEFPEELNLKLQLQDKLRYGENPHQKAAFYRTHDAGINSLTRAKKLHGKELSYNNINDAEAALNICLEFTEPTAVVVKHMNPCGVGTASNHLQAFSKAYASDPVSIFGGIVCINGIIEEDLAKLLSPIFLEIVIAKGYTEKALKILTLKKDIRLLEIPFSLEKEKTSKALVSIKGGLLMQDIDSASLKEDDLTFVTKIKPSKEEIKDLLFAMKVVKHVKSNAIVVCSNLQSLGIGAGQMNRIGSAEIALKQADSLSKGAKVLASDAFFPFDDCVKLAAKYNVKAIIQPGGSKRDDESIKACDELGISMVFTGIRHFRH